MYLVDYACSSNNSEHDKLQINDIFLNTFVKTLKYKPVSVYVKPVLTDYN